jgi:hypothetical protein
MPVHRGRPAVPLVPVLLALLVAGCAGESGGSGAGGQATTTTVAATTTTAPRMTAKELAWLKSVETLHKKIDKVFTKEGSVFLTHAKMTEYANTLRSCTRELARIGAPSDRLRPVYTIVKKACRTYDKGAKCWATAISVSDVGGGVTEPNLPASRRAVDCAHEAQGNGSNLLNDAELEGKQIVATYGG